MGTLAIRDSRGLLSIASMLLSAMLCSALATGCVAPAQPLPPGAGTAVGYEEQASAPIVAVQRTARLITVQSASGEKATVYVDPEVGNFSQMRAGDTVLLTYQRILEVHVHGGTVPASAVLVNQALATAAPGERPAALWHGRTSRTVQVISIDHNTRTVPYREPDGSLDSVVVQDPRNYWLVDRLTPGTLVDVTDYEILAVSVERI
jgi:hypothetical protein